MIDQNNNQEWPNFLQDYPEALLRIASLRADKQFYLLFAWVELYPFDMTAPASWNAGVQPWRVPHRKGWSCGFSATKLQTGDALRWYNDARHGHVSFAPAEQSKIRLQSTNFAPEPAIGDFASAVDAPFTHPWHDGPRIHRLVPMQKPARPICDLKQIKEARQWLSEHLGFDPYQWDEWLAGIALIAPDPLCASLAISRSKRNASGSETLSLQMVPRRSATRVADLTSLTVTIAEQRAGAWTNVTTLPIAADGHVMVNFPQPTGAIGYALVCRERGLLRFQEPHHWIDQVSFNISMGSRQAQIEVPPGGRRKPGDSYAISLRSEDRPSTIGEPVNDRARKRLIYLTARRRNRERLARAPQKLFGVQPAAVPSPPEIYKAKAREAQTYIVALIEKARHRLIFVDPFFGQREMRNFALRNGNAGVTPRILTGHQALKIVMGSVPGFQVQQGLLFADDLRSLAVQLGDHAPQVRVMPNLDRAVIHDRYLLVDEEVWQCGPSFNELGERLGLVTRLPNPREIRHTVGRVWRYSQPLLDLMPKTTPEEPK